jgi:hypothetical protein
MLFHGQRLLLLFNRRLTVVQVLPATWIWAAMLDLKLHVLHGASFHVLRGLVLIPIIAGVVAITAASFFLNAVFAVAITRPGPPKVRPAFTNAPVPHGGGARLGTGRVALGVVHRDGGALGLGWFTMSLSIVLGIMMVCYVAVPSRLTSGPWRSGGGTGASRWAG